MTTRLRLASAVLLLATLAACSGDRLPVAAFKRDTGTPWFESFQQRGDQNGIASVKPDTRTFLVYIDCVGTSGAVEVSIGGVLGTEKACSGDDPGLLTATALSPEEELGGQAVQVDVTAPRDAHWSVAIDQTPMLEPLRGE